MRKEIENRLILSQTVEGESDKSGAIFKTYAAKKDVGTWILDSLLKQRVKVNSNYIPTENGKYNVFFSDEIDKKIGYLSSIYGYVGVISLALRMEVTLTDEQKKDIVDNVELILDYIDENGYTLAPFVSDEENAAKGELFGRKYPYVGAMTWALSFFTSIRNAVKEGLIELSERRQDELVSNIKRIIEFFNRSVIREKPRREGEKGRALGWGYTEGCATPSLFFTYSVLEAYSDFEDNVFDLSFDDDVETRLESDHELLEAINKGNGENEHIEIEWKNNCYEIADYVWDVYHDVLKEDFVDDTFLKGYHIVEKEDILKSEKSNALFNNIYLVCILLYGYVNRRNRDKEDVVMTMESALQNVQRMYNQLSRTGMEYLVDTYTISFKSRHVEHGYDYTKLNYKSMMDATLIPMLVKANNIIAFYISQYPVKQMGTFFEGLFDKMQSADSWIWEANGYDVKITERYIEAIADFFGYHEKYEKDYATNKRKKDAMVKKQIEDAKRKTEERVREEALAAAEKKYEENVQAVRDEYVIENTIRAAIRGGVLSSITDAMNGIARGLLDGSVKLTDENKALRDAFENMMSAFIVAKLRSVTANKEAMATVEKNFKTDADLFLAEWAEKLERENDTLTKILKGDNK